MRYNSKMSSSTGYSNADARAGGFLVIVCVRTHDLQLTWSLDSGLANVSCRLFLTVDSQRIGRGVVDNALDCTRT